MSVALPMFNQETFPDLFSATSLQASEDGATRCASPDGPTIAPSGRGAARDRRSRAPAKRSAALVARAGAYYRILSALEYLPAVTADGNGPLTRDTFGLNFAGSSSSAILQISLENRLRARMEKYGSLEYELAWKSRDMALGRPICALRGSARRTSVKGFTGWLPDDLAGWRSPDSNQRGGAIQDWVKILERIARGHQVNLEDQSMLVGWPTPNAMEGGQTRRGGKRRNELLMGGLVGWATPSSRDWKDTPGMATTGTNPDGSTRARIDQLPRQAAQAIRGWATPRAEDAESSGMRHGRGIADTLSAQVGQDLTSFHAGTEKRGALNPAHSRWLMGFPVEWDSCGATAMQSCRNSRRNSSSPRASLIE